MQKIILLLSVIAIVAANDVIIYKLLKPELQPLDPDSVARVAKNHSTPTVPKIIKPANEPSINQHPVAANLGGGLEPTIITDELLAAVQSVMYSPDFTQIMDDYEVAKEEQRLQLRDQLGGLNAAQLLSVITGSMNALEKNIAIRQLFNVRGIKSLADAEISSLADVPLNNYFKFLLLSEQYDRNIPGTLYEIKNLISSTRQLGRLSFNQAIYQDINDEDPEFITALIARLDVKQPQSFRYLTAFAKLDQPAVSSKLVDNFDEALDSGSGRNALMRIDRALLTSNHFDKIIDLFDSRKTSERAQGMQVLSLINDVNSLRTIANKLNTDSERRQFITRVTSSKDSKIKKFGETVRTEWGFDQG